MIPIPVDLRFVRGKTFLLMMMVCNTAFEGDGESVRRCNEGAKAEQG